MSRLRARIITGRAAVALGIALAYLGLALADGGFAPEAVAAATILVWWAALAAMIVRRRRVRIPGLALACGGALAALAVLGAVSLAWASDDGRGFVDVVRAAGYVGLFALVAITAPASGARPWLVGLALGFVAVAALALGSRFIPALPDDSSIGDMLIGAQGRLSYPIGYWNGLAACMVIGVVLTTWLGARGATRSGRALAVAALPLFGLALYLTSSRGGLGVCLIAVAALIAMGPSRLRLLAAFGLGAVSSIGLVLLARLEPDLINDTGTAAAASHGTSMSIATLLVAIAVGLAWYLSDRALDRVAVSRRFARGALAGLAVVVVAGVVAADPLTRLEEFDDTPSAADTTAGERFATTSGSGRAQYWSTALDAFAEAPLGGLGSGGFQSFWDRYGSTAFIARHAHSAYLETLAELGLAGLLLLVAFIAAAVVAGLLRRASSPQGDAAVWLAILAAGCLTAAIEWTWELPAAFAPAIVAAALLTRPALGGEPAAATEAHGAKAEGGTAPPGPIAAPEAQTTELASPPSENGDGRRSPTERLRRFGWGFGALACGGVAIGAAGVLLLAEAKLDESRDAFDRGDLEAAAQAAFDATRLEPWASEPQLQLALVEEAEGDLTAARVALGDARRLARDDWRSALITARVTAALGRRQGADEAIARARRLNPRLPGAARTADRDRGPREDEELALSGADDFDPQGTPVAEEHPELTSLAIDADPVGTAWTTEQYETEALSGLKPGVGIYVELADPATPQTLRLSSAVAGWSAEVYATSAEPPTTLEGWGAPIGGVEDASTETQIELSDASESRFVLLWLTSLAASGDDPARFSVSISDIELTGVPDPG